MNVFHCTKKNIRIILGSVAVLVICVYIPLNVVFMIFGSPLQNGGVVDGSNSRKLEVAKMAIEVSNIEPDVDGNIKVVLSLNVNDLLKFVEGNTDDKGEATHNALPNDVKFLLNNRNICKDSPDLKYIVYIHTSPDHVEKRNLLRTTWASVNLFNERIIATVFLMGLSNEHDVQEKVRLESEEYGDIVQGNFMDNYRNLTLKGLMGLQWVSMYCKQAKFAIKADDDAFVNIFNLVHFLEKNEDKKNMLACPLWSDNSMPILRDPAKCSKWCVKFNEFPGRRYFPKYCAGLTFILSNELVPLMYEASKTTPFFWIDDVYITGLLTSKVKTVEYIPLIKNFTLKQDEAFDQLKDVKEPLTYLFVHAKKSELFKPMWNQLLNRLHFDDVKLLRTDLIENNKALKNTLKKGRQR